MSVFWFGNCKIQITIAFNFLMLSVQFVIDELYVLKQIGIQRILFKKR